MLMVLMKFSFVPQHFFRFFFLDQGQDHDQDQDFTEEFIKKVMLYILKIVTKFGVPLQSFCGNQNSSQDQDQDQDHYFTLDFNTRPTFHTSKTPTKFCLDSLTPSKVIVSTARIYVRTARRPDRREFFLLVLSSKTYKT